LIKGKLCSSALGFGFTYEDGVVVIDAAIAETKHATLGT
jgi:hypothetical protein